jgi:hypothetical protein
VTPLTIPEGWEAWLAFFRARLPDPIEEIGIDAGTVCFQAGDPLEVVVRLGPRSITVFDCVADESGPAPRRVRPRRLATVRWTALAEDAGVAVVSALIEAARRARRATYRICARCERPTAPERMHDDEICEPCAAEEARAASRPRS